MTDEELIQRAFENGWEQMIAVTDRWPCTHKDWPFTGWLTGDRTGIPVRPGEERTEWIGGRWNRHQNTYVDSWAHVLRPVFDHDDRCQECGLWIEYERYIGMERERAPIQHCWHCRFWLAHIPLPERSFVAAHPQNGKRTFYAMGGAKSPSSHNGYGGTWMTVTFQDGREVETCDLWCGGDIPERFHDRLPITATLRVGRKT
jgi:hypothetical protein